MSNVNIVAEFSGDNLKLFKRGLGIVYNAEITNDIKKHLKKIVNDEEQKPIAVVAAPGATEERTSNEKAILYGAGFSDVIYVQPTIALASYFGYKFTEAVPVFSVVIGEDATDLAIIMGGKTLYSGIIDIGVNSCIHAISNYIIEKYGVEAGFAVAQDVFNDVASLLPADGRYAKFPDFIIKAEQVREVIYPLYSQILGAINHMLNDASVDVIREINNTGVVFGGVGAGIRGLSKAVYSVIGLQSLIAEDENNATLLGAGMLLDNTKLLLKLTNNA